MDSSSASGLLGGGGGGETGEIRDPKPPLVKLYFNIFASSNIRVVLLFHCFNINVRLTWLQ